MISKQIVKDFNNKLEKNNISIFCAESITAGLLASTIASASGASKVLAGSIVTYDKRVKTVLLGVSEKLLDTYSAESQEVTTAMCEGLRKSFLGVGIYVAVTGVASESVNNYEIKQPLGQVFVSVWYNGLMHEFQEKLTAGRTKDQRNAIRRRTVLYIFKKIAALLPDTENAPQGI